jgi:hypothetical protein
VREVALLLLGLASCAEPAKKDMSTARPSASLVATSRPPPVDAATPAMVDAAPSEPVCSAGVDGGVIDVFIKREVLPATPEREKAVQGVVMTAPSLHLRIELVTFEAPMSCRTVIRAAAQRMTAYCTFSPGSVSWELHRERNRLIFDSEDREVATPTRRSELHPPETLPCGSRVVFHHFKWRDPKWSAFGSPCSHACADKNADCEQPCITNLTDESGELTDAGTKCADACKAAHDKCRSRCPPQ